MILLIDLQQRSGIKILVCNAENMLLQEATMFPLISRVYWEDTIIYITKLIIKYKIDKIAITTGNVFKHANRLVNTIMQRYPDLKLMKAFTSLDNKNKNFLTFNTNLSTIKDLKKGLVLCGLISNINEHGIFVDLGLNTQGLIYKNTLPRSFSQTNEKFMFGNIIKVEVQHIDLINNKFSLKIHNNDPIKPNKKESVRTNTALFDALIKVKIGAKS